MSGWLLILALLMLGGILSTLGDRLGSRVGKARLSLMGMRPRKTAVLITVLTGSLISAMSLGLMLLVSERLRVGLFQLDQLEARLQQSRNALQRSSSELLNSERERKQAHARALQLRRELTPLLLQRNRLEAERDRLSREVSQKDQEIRSNKQELASVRQQIAASSRELKGLESNLIALRRGDVVISSGQPLATAKVRLEQPSQASDAINALLMQANRNAFARVLPGEPPNRQILLVPRSDINKLEQLLKQPGSWVVSILSAANVLRGERQVLGFPDLKPNRAVVAAGDVLASTTIEGDLRDSNQLARRLNLLLAAAYARAQRQGTLVDGLQFDIARVNQLVRELSERPGGQVVQLEAVALNQAETPDPIGVDLRWVNSTMLPPPLGRRF
ncbi:MAG: DUF3084 domain-containing protein [Cyanobacteria bacterium K_DeepCast_35m_m2_023]|nr:DUF3084 domain-containing protein [Cyanobacteria bacterium K_DeepCast_35m_m2_023]